METPKELRFSYSERVVIPGKEIRCIPDEFGVGISPNDVLIVVRRNGKNQGILNSSHVTAKTFANALIRAIEDFEKKTHQTILESNEIEKLMKENEEHNS